MPYPSHYSTFANRCRLWLPLYWASRPSLITCGLCCVGWDMICVIADEYDWLICSHVPVYLGCSLFGMRVLQHLLYFSTVSRTLCVLLVVRALRRITTSVELEPPTNSLWLFCEPRQGRTRTQLLSPFVHHGSCYLERSRRRPTNQSVIMISCRIVAEMARILSTVAHWSGIWTKIPQCAHCSPQLSADVDTTFMRWVMSVWLNRSVSLSHTQHITAPIHSCGECHMCKTVRCRCKLQYSLHCSASSGCLEATKRWMSTGDYSKILPLELHQLRSPNLLSLWIGWYNGDITFVGLKTFWSFRLFPAARCETFSDRFVVLFDCSPEFPCAVKKLLTHPEFPSCMCRNLDSPQDLI